MKNPTCWRALSASPGIHGHTNALIPVVLDGFNLAASDGNGLSETFETSTFTIAGTRFSRMLQYILCIRSQRVERMAEPGLGRNRNGFA